jgi:hypothetical protein
MASKGQNSAQNPQFMQTSTSMKNSDALGIALAVTASLPWTIQMHWGGQTFAQIPQAVHRSV